MATQYEAEIQIIRAAAQLLKDLDAGSNAMESRAALRAALREYPYAVTGSRYLITA